MGLAQYVNQYLARHKKFGPAQNVLGLVKGQGISLALILGTAAAVQDDDDDNFTTLIKDPTKLQRYLKDPWV